MLNTHSIGFNYMKLIDMCKRYMKSNARFYLFYLKKTLH